MKIIDLSRAIFNEDSYVDYVIQDLRWSEPNEEMIMNITSPGGDVYQGSRIHREIMLYPGKTKAVVVGVAASMAGVLLAAFDEVEIDSEAGIMLHKGRYENQIDQNGDPIEYTEDQKNEIKRFNQIAYNRLKAKGVNEEFLNKVFLSDSEEDHWLTAKEAEEMGIGKAVELTREEGKPVMRLVAQMEGKDFKQVYNNFKNRNVMFGLNKKNNKATTKVLNIADGNQVLFNSIEQNIAKGASVVMAGSNEEMNGEYKINDKLIMVVDKGIVAEMKEEDEGSDDEPEGIEAVLAEMKKLNERLDAQDEKIEALSNKGDDEKLQGVLNEINEKAESLNGELEAMFNIAKQMTGNFVPPKNVKINEPVQTGLTAKQEKIKTMKSIASGTFKAEKED